MPIIVVHMEFFNVVKFTPLLSLMHRVRPYIRLAHPCVRACTIYVHMCVRLCVCAGLEWCVSVDVIDSTVLIVNDYACKHLLCVLCIYVCRNFMCISVENGDTYACIYFVCISV